MFCIFGGYFLPNNRTIQSSDIQMDEFIIYEFHSWDFIFLIKIYVVCRIFFFPFQRTDLNEEQEQKLYVKYPTHLNLAVSGSSSRSSRIGDFGTELLNNSISGLIILL